MSQPPPPPMPAAPTAAGPVSPGPSRKWYLVPVLLLLLITGPSIFSFVGGLGGITEGLIRVVVPGETELTLEEGTWTVFYEWQGEFEGQSFTTSSEFPGMEAVVVADDGTQLPVEGSFGDFDYSTTTSTGFSVGEVDIPEDGTYTFAAQASDPTSTEQFVIALGKDIGRSAILLAVGLIGMIAGVFFAFVIWLIIIILRSRAKKRMQMAGYAV